VLWSASPPLADAGPADAPARVPGSNGQDDRAGEAIAVLPWNDLGAVTARLAQGDVAAVIMEPAMCNSGGIPPEPGYLEGVRAACSEAGAVLIFDEVITGFRLAPGGAQELFGVTPDLVTLGKALAAGFPVAAVAGRADLMEQLGGGAGGGVVHAGTYNGQAPMMAAVVATLEELRTPETRRTLADNGAMLRAGVEKLLIDHDIPARVQGWPEVFNVSLGATDPITDYRVAQQADRAGYVRLAAALLDRGLRVLERGTWFVSTTHTPEVIGQTLEALDDALSAVATTGVSEHFS
jgi:glutamate-1-semialdehyde 2,1-aminomutase